MSRDQLKQQLVNEFLSSDTQQQQPLGLTAPSQEEKQASYFNSGGDSSAFRLPVDAAVQMGSTAVRSVLGDAIRWTGDMVNANAVRSQRLQGYDEDKVAETLMGGTPVGNTLRKVGDFNHEQISRFQDWAVSDQRQQALEQSTPQGDITRPSTWTAGEDPTFAGHVMLLADTLGSYGPEVAANLLTRGMGSGVRIGATAGASAGSGGGAQSRAEGERIADMSHQELQERSALYNELLERGYRPDQAKLQAQRLAEAAGAETGGLISGAGGAVMGYILGPAKRYATDHIASRAGRTATLGGTGAASEVVHEVGTEVGSRLDSATRIGEADRDLTEDTLQSAVMGMAGGGAVGTGAGLTSADPVKPASDTPETEAAQAQPEDHQGAEPQTEPVQPTDAPAAGEARSERTLDTDIQFAERQGFDEEAVRLRNVKQLYQRAEEALSRGDTQLAQRQRERANAIHQDIFGEIQQQAAASGLPVPYQAEGELVSPEQSLGLPVPYQQRGNTIDQQPPQLENQNIIYGEAPATEPTTVQPPAQWQKSIIRARQYAQSLVDAGQMPQEAFDSNRNRLKPLVEAIEMAVNQPSEASIKASENKAIASIDQAALQVDTNPTEAQKEAGNYKKGHVSFQGLDVTIENPKGSTRSGTSTDGTAWESEMAHHYGYLKRTEGADGDHVDVFIGDNSESGKVFVVDQINPDGTFDEHKVMLGFDTQKQAEAGYMANYEKGWQGLGRITETSLDDFKAWLETGDTTSPFAQDAESGSNQESQQQATEPSQPTAPIEDAGEKLGGARKDEMRTLREKLASMDDADIANSTLSKLWPKNEIDNIQDNVAAAIYQTARDHIPSKPRKPYLVKRWVENVKLARELVSITEKRGGDQILELMRENKALSQFANKVELLRSLPREHWDRVGRVESVSGQYKQDGDWVKGNWFVVEIDKRRQHFHGHKKVETVIPEVKSALDDSQPSASQMKFEIRTNSRTKEVYINKTGDAERRRLKTFASVEDARKFLRNNHDELVQAWDAVKNRDNVAKADVRSNDNQPRTGIDHRQGKNITPDEFLQAFGFRGVEFGNWVKQGKDKNERQQLLNDTYDAFMDLADVLNIPPEALSLNGRLGIGMGSRGKGRANAHFEPDRHVINLTKTRGAGSLAHEWFHALDNYFARFRGEPEFTGDQKAYREQAFVTYRPEPMMVYKPSYEAGRVHRMTKAEHDRRVENNTLRADEWMADPEHPQGIRPEVEKAFADIVRKLDESPMRSRSSIIDKGKADGYWSQIIERGARAFETYVIASMADRGYRNDFLANVVPVEHFTRNPERYPYLTESEQKPVNEAFDKLFETLETRETPEGVALFKLDSGDAAGIPREQAEAAIKEQLGKLASRVNVIDTPDQLPLAAQLALRIQGVDLADAQGIYHDGQVYAIASNLDSIQNAIDTAIHEVVGHEGLRGLLGDRLDAVMDQVYQSFQGSQQMKQLREHYDHLDYRKKEDQRILAEELLAHLAEHQNKPKLLRRVISAIRDALRQLFPGIRWTAGDVYSLIDSARRHVERENQKRSGTVNDPTLLKKRQTIAERFPDTDADQQSFLGKIGADKPGAMERAGEWLKKTFDRIGLRFRQGAIDKYAALMEMDKKLFGESITDENIQSSSWVLARMAAGSGSVVGTMMEMGRVYWDAKNKVIDVQEDTVGKGGLTGVLYQLGNAAEIERFMGWVAANRSKKLAAEGRENLFTPEEIEAGVRLNQGKTEGGRERAALYDKVFQEFQQYRDDVLQIAEASGIITPENRAMWKDEFYVPFYRVQQEVDAETKGPRTGKGLTRQEAYKRLKGADMQLNDLLENTLMNFHHLIESSLKNVAASQAMDNAMNLGLARQVTESSRDPKTSTFIQRDGEKVWHQIDDPLVYNSLVAMQEPPINFPGMSLMRKFKRIFTQAITATPQFQFSILMRDSMQAMATSKMPYNMPKNIVRGAIAYGVSNKTSLTKARMMATGGSMNFGHIFGADPEAAKLAMERDLKKSNLISQDNAGKVVRKAWDKWMDVTNTAENINRATIFEHNYQQNKLKAAFEARDLIDYSQHGSSAILRFFIDVVPFLNARIQGLDKLYRTGFKPTAKVVRSVFGGPTAEASDMAAAKRFSLVVGALSMATVALYLNNRENEDYEKLEDWDKDTYWHFFVGGAHFRLHKPFEVGAIATLVERTTQQFVDEKATGKLFAQRLGHMLAYTFSMDPTPQAINPMMEVWANKNKFTGRQIESMAHQRLSPSQRVNPNTTKHAQWISRGLEGTLGAAFGKDSSLVLSPVQIDHLIGGYLGQIGASASSTADVIFRSALGETQPEKRWHEYQPFRRFYQDTTIPGYEKYGTLFYDRLTEVRRVYADIQNYRKLGEMERARELANRHRSELGQRQVMERASRQMAALNARATIVRNNHSLSPTEKRAELDRIRAMQNRLQKMVVDRLDIRT